MMQTRCPACGTTFHVTPEQMRVKGGKVRCGHCRVVFNALAYLMVKVPSTTKASLLDPLDFLPDTPVPPIIAPVQPARQAQPEAFPPIPPPEPTLAPDLTPAPEPAPVLASSPSERVEPTLETLPSQAQETPEPAAEPVVAPAEAPVPWHAPPLPPTLEAEGESVIWPFALAAVVLCLTLVGQLAYHYRVDLAARSPALESLFQALGAAVPVPRQVELVAIETSDLQSDPAHQQLILQATLVNKAGFAQAWPAVELTLTDAQDNVMARRVFEASQYLGRKALQPLFPARQETSLRLHLRNDDLNPAGYRLYVFYP